MITTFHLALRRLAPWVAAATLAAPALPALAADVGVSVSISQPGVYGRVDIGRFPTPQVILAEPVIVARPRVTYVQPEPVYLWVPDVHRRQWPSYCGRYNACGVPVYFVRERWYHEHVHRGPPRHAPAHGYRHHGRGHGHGHGRD